MESPSVLPGLPHQEHRHPRYLSGYLGNHQYTRAFGTIELVNSIAKYHTRYQNLNPLTDICVNAGGVGALYSSITGLVNPGEEVILFTPFYDCYQAHVQMAGGISRTVALKPKHFQSKEDIKNRGEGKYVSGEKDDWEIDWDGLKQALNDKTKAILINSPHNPTGKVFTEEEIKKIADLLREYPKVIVIEDNVYEGLTFDEYYQKPLPKLAFEPGFHERTIGVYSAGKIFAATGIRVGWAIGPAHLIKGVQSVAQYTFFCINDSLQRSCAQSLDLISTNTYLKEYADTLIKNRNLLIDVLLESKYDFKLWVPKGGFFIMADISNVEVNPKYLVDEKTGEKRLKDMAFCIQLAREDGVVAIPCSTFFDSNQKPI